jgi:hypothetical protein
MTNPTSNFGWQMPTPTDLVTDLPADFEVFGQAVDTDFADLLGGTTGQILSKASATDLDFTWITNDVGDITAVNVTSPITGGGSSGAVTIAIQDATTSVKGAVQLSDSTSTTSSVLASTPTATKSAYDLAAAATPKSTFTAKGSIAAATAASTPANLTVGNNGEALVADSSTSTGLRYQTLANENACINGGMDIWQRGTSFSIASATPQYTADRWTNYFNNTGTIAQETTLKPDTSTYSLKVTNTATSADNAIFQLVEQQQMEQFRGKVVTLSVKLAGTLGLAPSITLAYSTTANDTLLNTNTQISAGSTLNPSINASTFVTWALTFTVPTTAKQLRIGIGTGSVVNTNVLYVAEVQLELGSVATTFKKSGGSIGGELALCQRYYWRNTTGAAYGRMAFGAADTTTTVYLTANNPVQMRTIPTALDYSTNLRASDTVGNSAITALTLNTNFTNAYLSAITGTVASGLTQNRFYYLEANNNVASYIGLSAEL